jgi:hypothetical protein
VQESKSKFIEKGKIQMEDISNYFQTTATVKEVQDSLSFLKDHCQKNGNSLRLGHGHIYDRTIAFHWIKVSRFLAADLNRYTKRTSTIQGLTMEEFRRTRTLTGYVVSVGEHKNGHLNDDTFEIPMNKIELWTQFYAIRKLCVKKEMPWLDKHQLFINICGTALKNFTVDVNKALPHLNHRFSGRNMRTSTATASSTLSPSKQSVLRTFISAFRSHSEEENSCQCLR